MHRVINCYANISSYFCRGTLNMLEFSIHMSYVFNKFACLSIIHSIYIWNCIPLMLDGVLAIAEVFVVFVSSTDDVSVISIRMGIIEISIAQLTVVGSVINNR